MATIKILAKDGTTALIFWCDRVAYRKKHTSFYASDKRAHWSTGFGFDMPVVINGDRDLRQSEYRSLIVPGHVTFEVLSGTVNVRAM